MKFKITFLLFVLSIFLSKAQDNIHPQGLLCEYMANPVVIDKIRPQLSWYSVSEASFQKQSAYQILVASSIQILDSNKGDLWDSGKIISDQSQQVIYAGKPLDSEAKVYWKVKVWDKNDKDSEWSTTATWAVGLLKTSDWAAKWIGMDVAMKGEKPLKFHPIMPARMVRKEQEIAKDIQTATLYVSAGGLYEFYINGNKVGTDVLTPALSQTEKRSYYNAYSVEKLLRKGKNALASYLGCGRWTSLRPLQEATGEWVENPNKDTIDGVKARFPKLIAQINITFTDGTKQTIGTDQTWKITTDGPITKNNEYDGESYDANKELLGWDMPLYDDKNWLFAQQVIAPSPILSAENKEPIKVVETIKPVAFKEIKPNTYIYDMGQNMVGWAKIKIKGAKGTAIKMTFAEILKPDGSLYLANMRSAQVTDTYTLKGDAKGESWEPRFVYHGFRYIEISGLDTKPDLNTIEGKVVHDNIETIGQFECSNPTMTQLHKNAYWGIKGNYRSMPTDCPQRDERLGWLGDRSVEVKGEAYIFRNTALYKKWMQDINDAQLDNGSIPDVAPTHSGTVKIYSDGVVWPSCFVILPYAIYALTGDKNIIIDNYEAMKKFTSMVISEMKNGIIDKNTYGDWCMPPERIEMIFSEDPKRVTSGVLLSSCYLYYDFNLMAMYASMQGKTEDATFFRKEALALKKAINNNLFDAEKLVYDNNSMSSSLIPLGTGVVESTNKASVFKNAIQKLIVDLDTKIATGLIGGQWQMKTLAENGRPDLAYSLATNTTYPSWGYQIEKGATTIWELWNGDKARPDMNSGNHVMLLGDVIIWMYENVAGIASDPNNPGFKKIIMKPDLSEKVSFVKASHFSLYGRIASDWKYENNNFSWNIQIPVNTSALVYVPAQNEKLILINNKNYVASEGISFIKMENGKAMFEIPSGKYTIVSKDVSLPTIKENNFNPKIFPSDTVIGFMNPTVTIKPTTKDATIYYTTDGSNPTEKSNRYTGAFTITKSSKIKAISAKNGFENSSVSISNIELYDAKINGWNYTYYEGNWKMIPDFSKEKVIKSGNASGLNIENIKQKEDFWGIVFSSNIWIDTEATYTFYLTSDDGSRLLIDDKQVAIINGTHGAQTGMGNMKLSKGMHKIKVEYFEAIGGQSLELTMQPEGGNRKVLPLSKLFLKPIKK